MSDRTLRGTPAWLRSTNDRTALELLLEHGALTRLRLGELSGLSKPTASQMVQRLENAGLIHPVGTVSGSRGPSAASYSVRIDRRLGVAVDVTPSLIRSTIVDASGAEHPVETIPTVDGERSAVTDITAAIAAATEAAGVNPASVHLVSVAVQGSYDAETDELAFAESMPGWQSEGIRQVLEAATGRSVFIDNDVNLAAIAERSVGAPTDAASFALLWMGDGLGLAVDIAGVVHRGASGGAGEIGYLPVTREASAFDPTADDLQDLIGPDAVAMIASRVTGSPAPRKDDSGAYAAALDLLSGSGSGDGASDARDAIIAELAPRIAMGIVPVLALLDPERVVLGGPTGAAGGTPLAHAVGEHIVRSTRWHPTVVASSVEHLPVLHGARDVLIGELRARLFDEVDRIAVG
ncbi:ROK family transcriptional regulator [Plantibacter sp. YIM 135249]|uniref:ROK family transcriptional regulator n=1 Tax=Plantibacter sp. YIM 135249 TaxID=3423918 RepID=UPI003D347A53